MFSVDEKYLWYSRYNNHVNNYDRNMNLTNDIYKVYSRSVEPSDELILFE